MRIHSRRFLGSCGSAAASTSLFFFNNLVQNKSKMASLLSLDRAFIHRQLIAGLGLLTWRNLARHDSYCQYASRRTLPKCTQSAIEKYSAFLELLGFVPLSWRLQISRDYFHSSMSSVWLFKTATNDSPRTVHLDGQKSWTPLDFIFFVSALN